MTILSLSVQLPSVPTYIAPDGTELRQLVDGILCRNVARDAAGTQGFSCHQAPNSRGAMLLHRGAWRSLVGQRWHVYGERGHQLAHSGQRRVPVSIDERRATHLRASDDSAMARPARSNFGSWALGRGRLSDAWFCRLSRLLTSRTTLSGSHARGPSSTILATHDGKSRAKPSIVGSCRSSPPSGAT